MPKKKKKFSAPVYSPEAIKAVKKNLREFNWRRALTLALSTIAVFAVFEALLSFEAQRRMTYSPVTVVFYVIVTVLSIAVIFLNHGFSKKTYVYTCPVFIRFASRCNLPFLWRHTKKYSRVVYPGFMIIITDFTVYTLASSSKGNSVYVKCGCDELLIDAGTSARKLECALNSLGSSIKRINAIFITHEHTDHTSALETISKKYAIPVHFTEASAHAFLCSDKTRATKEASKSARL